MPGTPRIVADADIPYLDPVLGPIGTLIPVPGHRIGPEHVRNADALVVRSVTRVNSTLLARSDVKFVGSATSGIDHVDTSWLDDQGIGFVHAAGANAESVVEYVLGAMVHGLEQCGGHLEELTLGVVGCGRIGERLVRRAQALGMTVVANDPPLIRAGKAPTGVPFVSLHEVLARSNIVSVHVPLVRRGRFPTAGLIDEQGLHRMKSGAWLIQSSRGGTVDEAAAVHARREGRLAFLAIDVWENEPEPDALSIESADIATPHVAGYSRDAKLTGICMIRDALLDSLGRAAPEQQPGTATETSPPDLPSQSAFVLKTEKGPDRTNVFRSLVPQMIDLAADDARFRRVMAGRAVQRAESFHRLRATYPPRWSFVRYHLAGPPPGDERAFLTHGVGIRVP